MSRFTVLLALAAIWPASAAAQPAAKPAPSAPAIPVASTWTLPNGLTVAHVERTASSAVAVQVWYRVGSKNDPAERRGMAHLFEHLMERGSSRVRPGGHQALVASVGGRTSAVTTEDATGYQNEVPASQLELALALEADRMRGLSVREDVMKADKEIAKSEVRANLSNPLYRGVSALMAATFGKHPYSWTSPGALSDLDAISREEAVAHYNAYYQPSNAIVVVVGGVGKAAVQAAVAKHFGGLAKAERPEQPKGGDKPAAQTKTARVTANRGEIGFVLMGYRLPTAAKADAAAIQALALVLSRGREGRLSAELVGKGKPVIEAGAQAVLREHPGILLSYAAFNKRGQAAAVEKQLRASLAKVKSGISPGELARAKRQLLSGLTFGLQTPSGHANQIALGWILTGDVNQVTADYARVKKLTAQQVARAAATYLRDDALTVVTVPMHEARKPAKREGAKR